MEMYKEKGHINTPLELAIRNQNERWQRTDLLQVSARTVAILQPGIESLEPKTSDPQQGNFHQWKTSAQV
jgi:hypothetical protein